MSEYRKKLVLQNWLLAVSAALLVTVQVLSFCQIIRPVSAGESWEEFWNGFIGGVALGLTVLFLIGLVRNLLALRSEKTLKKLYAKEKDERTLQIHTKGKSAGATVFLVGLIPATIICGYFSITVFFTCLACALALSLCMGGAKLYYFRKM